MNNMAHHGAHWQLSRVPGMDDAEFAQWADLLEARTGISLPAARKSFLVTSLTLRMREIGCPDYGRYYALVTAGPGGAVEWSVLVDRLTVHETRFFRHPASLALLARHLKARCAQLGPLSINAWSAGCATGEEAYSIAMVIEQQFSTHRGEHYFGVTGADISLAALDAARRGVYHRRRLLALEPGQMERCCTQVDAEHYQVCERLRERVCFTRMNMLEPLAPTFGGMDVIFCQNVLIYFSRRRRTEILNKIAQCLSPGGLLVLGPGEIVQWSYPGLERVVYEDTLAYYRTPI